MPSEDVAQDQLTAASTTRPPAAAAAAAGDGITRIAIAERELTEVPAKDSSRWLLTGAAAASVSPTPSTSSARRLNWPCVRVVTASDDVWPYIHLTAWFVLNVLITLYSKAIFSVYRFPCPLLLTAIHMLCTTVGVYCCEATGAFVPAPASPAIRNTMLWFSVVFTVNIWLSNASLLAVSVNLHQVVRTCIPLFTMVTSQLLFREPYPLSVLPSVLLVILGVAMTVWGDMTVTVFSLSVVLLGCFFSSLKGIVTQKTQVGALKLSSLDVLRWLCPMAVVQLLLLAAPFGEYAIIQGEAHTWDHALALHLPLLGLVAFALNFVSFRCAALLNPLTLNIAGNAKQVVTCLLSIEVFGGKLSATLLTGIVAAAVGAYWYSSAMARWRVANKEAARLTAAGSPSGANKI